MPGMAFRIALYGAEAPARFIEVDSKTKRTLDGEVLAENAAILQYIADRFPSAGLAPRDGMPRSRVHQWLCFIGTELHKALFVPLFDPGLPDEVKKRTLENGDTRLAYLDTHLNGREFLLEHFSIVDAYLFTVLNWKLATPVDLERWPRVQNYYARLKQRPSIARALSEEHALYAAEQARHRAA